MGAKFYIENEYSAQIDLQDETVYCIATDVSGFGTEFDSGYIGIGDEFIRNYLKPAQTELSLNLNFFQPNVYEKHQAVSDFILNAIQLYLVYKPDLTSGVEYRREVDIKSYLKNGVQAGYLCYTLTLKPTSLFYYKKKTRFEITPLAGEKRYDFRWDVLYNDYANREIVISGGQVEIAFEIEIRGYTENPKFEILDSEENILFALTFPVTLQEGEKVLYSSLDQDIHVEFVDAEGNVRNMYNDFGLEIDLFYKIPKTGATVRFSSDTDVMNTIVLTTYAYYRVV